MDETLSIPIPIGNGHDMTFREHKTTLLLGCALLLGAPALGDDEKAEQAYGDEAKAKAGYASWNPSGEELEKLFEEAMASCCAQGTCAEEGGCAAPCEGCEAGECTDEHPVPASSRLVSTCASSPGSVATLRPLIEGRFLAQDASESQREILLELLAWSESEASVATSEKLFKARPAAFREDHLLVFAPRSEAFEKPLAKLARKGRVRPAAFFALQEGHKLAKAAKATLVKAARTKTVDAENLADTLIAALALKELGEKKYVPAVRVKARDAALAALDGGNLDRARRIALMTEFLTEQSGYAKSTAYMGSQMAGHVASRSKEVATADEVFELIERISPM